MVDPEGLIWIQVIGGFIGAGINAYNSRDLWSQGEYGKFWFSVGSGFVTGVTATLGGGFVGGFLAGAVSGEANTLADHLIRRDYCKEFDRAEMDALSQKMIKASILGGVGSVIGATGGWAGKVFNFPGLRNLTSAQSGAITGTISNITSSIGLGID